MPATLKDIAKESGFDVSTVSRALKGSYGVHSSTREKVRIIAHKLDYRPNLMARGLVTGRSHTIALLISDIRNPFFTEVARGAEDAAYAAGFDVILCNSDLDPGKQVHYLRSFSERRIAGIVMNSVTSLTRAQQEELRRCDIPIVMLNKLPGSHPFSTVTADNFQGAILATNYLLGLGHRRIAHLAGPRNHGNLTERWRGFLSAVQPSRNVEAIVLHGAQNHRGGYEMTKKLLSQHPKVTAIFAANDVVAFGAIQTILEMGLTVPNDLSIVGFDNVDLSAIIHPPLTTVHQPKYEMGQAAVEILVKQAKSQSGRVPEHRVLGVRLVERKSCRPL
jgi:LacI family transcriptional regulator